jgi:hypothetical protein
MNAGSLILRSLHCDPTYAYNERNKSRSMEKYDSDFNYMQGPVNGSLYATVSRNQQPIQATSSQNSFKNSNIPGKLILSNKN